MKSEFLILVVGVFVVGFLLSFVVFPQHSNYDLSVPFVSSFYNFDENSIVFSFDGNVDDVWVEKDIENTNSMLPVLDANSIVFFKKVYSTDELFLHDIILVEKQDGNRRLHEIYFIGMDELGWFCYTKGTNNRLMDLSWFFPEKVRFERIRGKAITFFR